MAKLKQKKKERKPENTRTYNARNDEKVQKYFEQRGIKKSTREGYIHSLNQYIPFCGFKDATEMIQEAEEDEDKNIPTKKRRIKKRLEDYREYLKEKFKRDNTAGTYYAKVETFYRHNEITVPNRPNLTWKKDYHVSYFDLPTKEMIETAVDESEPVMKAVYLFQSSSGSAKNETLSITIRMFLEGLREYTDKEISLDLIKEFSGRQDLVPIIFLERIKTTNPYYTCCSPEATEYIFKYLKGRLTDEKEKNKRTGKWELVHLDSPLFNITGSYMMTQFQRINDKYEWGMVGPYRRFRSHTLRKFHASNLGCSNEIIDSLEGRAPSQLHATYIKTNPDQIKKVYMKYMHNVMLHPEKYPICQDTVPAETPELFGEVPKDVLDLQPPTQTSTTNTQTTWTNLNNNNMSNDSNGGITINGNVNIFTINEELVNSLKMSKVDVQALLQGLLKQEK